MYPSTSLFVAVGQLGIVILVLFSYPLQVHPCRNCLDKVFGVWNAPVPVKPVVEGDSYAVADEDHAHVEMTPFKHTYLTAGIVVLGFIIAYFIDSLELGWLHPTLYIFIVTNGVILIVLAFVGSTGSTTISFILPGLFYWKVINVFVGYYGPDLPVYSYRNLTLRQANPSVGRLSA